LIKDMIALPLDYKLQIDRISIDVGGSGFHVAKVLSLLGNKVELFGKVGNDIYGEMILEEIKKSKISTKNVKKVNFPTSFSLLFLYKGEKTILVYRGTNSLLSEKDLDENAFKKSEWFIFTSMTSEENIKFLRKAVEISKSRGIKVVCNPSAAMIDYQRENLIELMKKSDFVIMNEKESMKLAETDDPIKACKKLKEISKAIVIITLGEKGSVVFDKHLKTFKPYKVEVVNTTGAGDSFTAAFVHSFSKTKDIDYSMKFSNAYAALKISKGKGYFPNEKEVLKFMSERNVWIKREKA